MKVRSFLAGVLATVSPTLSLAEEAPPPEFTITPMAETLVRDLPHEPLFWHVDRFATEPQARDSAGENALFVAHEGAIWRFTLASRANRAPDGERLATIGPVRIPHAAEHLLRINRAGGPAGAVTPVHRHPGSEAFLVLTGRLCQRTDHGEAKVDAGSALNGHEPGTAMQLTSCGVTPLDQFVMFVVDAHAPFSSPAQFEGSGAEKGL